MLVLYGERGVVGRMFDPVANWSAKCAASVTGMALPSGHFIAEEVPELLLEQLQPFLAAR
jgi:haloacetate dehalogenase